MSTTTDDDLEVVNALLEEENRLLTEQRSLLEDIAAMSRRADEINKRLDAHFAGEAS